MARVLFGPRLGRDPAEGQWRSNRRRGLGEAHQATSRSTAEARDPDYDGASSPPQYPSGVTL
jgi:hypothetical protein